MKKAVGHLVPYMEKEREEALLLSGGVANENVKKKRFFIQPGTQRNESTFIL